MTVEAQKTFGGIVGMNGVVPVAQHETDSRVCNDCDEQTAIADYDAGLGLCHSCRSAGHTECNGCEEWTEDSEIIVNNRGDEECDSCSCDTNIVCEDCDETTHIHDSTHGADDRYRCDQCHSDTHFRCDGCGDEYHNDDAVSHDYDSYCESCASDLSCNDDDEWNKEVDRIESDDYDRIGSCRTFGVEMETSHCEGQSDWGRGNGWACVDDGSISGKEFVSPILSGNAGYDSMVNFIGLMDSNHCEVDSSCGFHTHIGVGDVCDDGIKAIALAYHYTRNVWESWVDKSRRDTYYARKSSNSKHGHSDQWDGDDIFNGTGRPDQSTRYVWINWKAYDKFKTYEVRSHEPTCDVDAVCNWVKAHTGFADYFAKMTVVGVRRLFARMTDKQIVRELRVILDETVVDYYTAKVEKEVQSS